MDNHFDLMGEMMICKLQKNSATRWLTTLVMTLLMAGCASQDVGHATKAATAPLQDLNLIKDDIPPVLLAAQYESFLLPFPVLLSLPIGIFGSYFALVLAGLDNNIYAQVALVMLIGLLAKNAILIVEFAIARNKEGYGIAEAAIEGARQRFRPILMTSFAFVAGLIPLCLAAGAGATGNRSIGMAAAGGMLIGTIFGIIVIPGLYILFAKMGSKKEQKQENIHHEE